MKISLRENCKITEADDGSLIVRIIKAGEGSSGTYTPELLRNSTHLFENTRSMKTHPHDGDPTKATFLDIVGVIKETWYDEEDESIWGKYYPLSEYRDRIIELRDWIGLSIFTNGTARKDENGSVIIESFDEVDEYRSVDVVIAAGAGGSFAPIMENLQLGGDRKENSMEIKDLGDKLDKLSETIQGFLTAQTVAAEKAAERETEVTKVEDAVAAYAESAAAIDKAELTESQREALKAEALKGVDVTGLIEAQVKIYKDVLAEAKVGKGDDEGGLGLRVHESKATDLSKFTVKGWK